MKGVDGAQDCVVKLNRYVTHTVTETTDQCVQTEMAEEDSQETNGSDGMSALYYSKM